MIVGLSGCGSNRPLNHRALVLAMGFSPAPKNRITLYMQIPTPQGLTTLTGGSGGGSSSGGSSNHTTAVLKGTGTTVAKAFADIQAESSQDLYLGQLQAMILSSKLSSTEFEDVASTLTRLGELDKTAYALVTTAPMLTVLKTVPATVPLAPLYYSTEFSCSRCQTVRLDHRIWAIEKRVDAPAIDLWLPVIVPEKSAFRIDRIAVYHHGRVQKILTARQTEIMGYALGRTEKGYVQMRWHGFAVSVRGLSATPSVRTRWRRGHLDIIVNLHAMGNIDEFPIQEPVNRHVTWLERRVSQKLAVETANLLTSLSHDHIEILNLGDAYVWQHPDRAAQWKKAYDQAHWTVRVTTRLRNLGDGT